MATAYRKARQLDSDKLASQHFAQVFQAYLECSDAVQAAIKDMVRIVNDQESTREEVDAAVSTIAEALFPMRNNGALGMDLDEMKNGAPKEASELLARLEENQATFAERVTALLAEKQMTQADLARATGVQPSAMSMLLSRDCRPQRRTVDKVAEALGVPPNTLWPG